MMADPAPAARPAPSEISARARDAREAALTLFARRGYHGTAVGEIASAMGLRRSGSLYNHIAGKQELLAEIFTVVSVAVWAEFEAAVDGLTAPPARLRAATRAYVERHLRHPRESTIVNRDVSALEEPALSAVMALRRRHAEAFELIIADGVRDGSFRVRTPRIAAYAILEMCVSVTHWFDPRGAATVQEIAEQYCDFALGLVRGPQGME